MAVDSKKESVVTKKVEAATVATKKPSKKSKRDVEVEVEIQKNPKKQKKELIQAEKKAPPKKKKKKKKKKNQDTDVKKGEAEQKSYAKQPNTLFAGHLSFKVKKPDIEKFFKEVGKILNVRISRGFAHVEFASAEEVQKALKLNGKPLLGRNILLDDANKKPPSPKIVKTIFVTGFNKSVDETYMKSALKDHFSACGVIRRISLPYYRETGDSKGVAYLDFNEGFEKALELNGSELGGRNIVVIEARPKIKNVDGNGDGSSARPECGNDEHSKNGPGRGNGDPRIPSKPSVLASAV